MIKAVLVCEGEVEELVEFETDELLAAYTAGVSAGAGHYGAGWVAVYTRDDLEELREVGKENTYAPYKGCHERIIAYIEANIPE